MIHRYDVDCVAGCEARCDWRFVEGEDRGYENLSSPENPTRSTKGNNITERVNRDQWGGTAKTTIWHFLDYVINMGVDYTGLGHWTWILVGSQEKITRIVMAYQPCLPLKSSKGRTVFKQHKHYF